MPLRVSELRSQLRRAGCDMSKVEGRLLKYLSQSIATDGDYRHEIGDFYILAAVSYKRDDGWFKQKIFSVGFVINEAMYSLSYRRGFFEDSYGFSFNHIGYNEIDEFRRIDHDDFSEIYARRQDSWKYASDSSVRPYYVPGDGVSISINRDSQEQGDLIWNILVEKMNNEQEWRNNQKRKSRLDTKRPNSDRSVNLATELEKLAALRREGMLSDEQFEIAKQKLTSD
jgi:hypothetical protein